MMAPSKNHSARATPARLVRDFGTPEQEAKTERWSQPVSEREPPQPPPDLMAWQLIVPPPGTTSETLPAKKVVRFQGGARNQTMENKSQLERSCLLWIFLTLGENSHQRRRGPVLDSLRTPLEWGDIYPSHTYTCD